MVKKPNPEWIGEIEVEHAQLRGLLGALEASLGAAPSDPVSWAALVRERVEAIVPLLAQHFAREEAALAPDAAAAVFPKLAKSLGALNQHHPRLLAAFRDSAGVLGAPDFDAQRVGEVTQRLRSSIAAMREHERAETELFELIELPD